MSDMGYNEIENLFSEAMKKAADRCLLLHKLTDNVTWQSVGSNLDMLRVKGEKMANQASLGKREIESGLKKHSDLWATDNG